jgi:hypothetical protein
MNSRIIFKYVWIILNVPEDSLPYKWDLIREQAILI